MLTTEEIQQRLPSITKTIGGHDVRNLEMLPIKNGRQVIIGELKHSGLDDSHWSIKDAIWLILDGTYGQWSGGSEWFDLELINNEEYLNKIEEKLKTITHTQGGYPVRNLELVYDHMDPKRAYLIRGDYYREEINDWVIHETWWLDGEPMTESAEFQLNLK
jgi:hypothetical protein